MIWALHGFLGRGSDWNSLNLPLRTPDLLVSPDTTLDLVEWSARFCIKIADLDSTPSLMGYSLGGRLALHALLKKPTSFCRAVIISAHTGLPTIKEQMQRVVHDGQWARRFEEEPWEDLMRDWDKQAVFGGHPNILPRKEADFSRTALAESLRSWGLGMHPSLLSMFHRVQCPVLWVVGEEDTRYREIGERAVAELPNAELWVCPNACHRVPWENPEAFREKVIPFLELDSENVSLGND